MNANPSLAGTGPSREQYRAGDRAVPRPAAITWIRPGAPVVLPASVRQTIACEAGTVWITQGDSEDYVLTAGQRLALAPRDEVVVSAMFAPAVIRRLDWPAAASPA
jgi:hypothetical protein